MSLLKTITKGKRVKPLAVLLHGVHGIGKSTFGANAKNPIFIGSEENDELDAPRFPKVTTWEELTTQLNTLLNEDHDYNTLVIDTIDSMEQVAQKSILSGSDKGKTMATAMGGFGKAYEKMRDMFLDIRDSYLIPLRDTKGMSIIILSHSEKVKHEDPITNTSYDHWQTSIHRKIKPVFEDWVSAILFANFELYRGERNDGKEYAFGDGERRIFSEERPSHIAKNRFNLEYEFPLSFMAFAKQVSDYYGKSKKAEKVEEKPSNDSVTELKYQITELISKLPDDIKERVNTAFLRAKDNEQELNKVLKRIQKTIS